MQQYTIFEVLQDGNLKIKLNPSLTREERKEARKLDWWELNEYEFCNGWYDINDFDRCKLGALTSAPIISDAIIDDEATAEEINKANVYWFPDYMVRDEKKELFSKGYVIFTKS